MKEYQVSFGKYVSKAELPALLKQLGYQGGAGGEGIILESVTTWYLKTGLSSDVTRETDPTGWKDYFTPPDPSSSGRYVWRYMDYWYTTNHHTPDFHVYTDCELVTMYSSGGGMGVEFAYALFDKIVSEVTILNEGEGNIPDTDPSAAWTKDLDTLIYNASQYLWMSQRIMDGETVGSWQKPIRISGKDGVGADGLDTEFIYKQMGRKPNSNEPAPVTENPLVNRNKDDYYPESDGWSDSPQGVEDDGLHNFEWMSYRTLLTENDPDYGTYKWSEFSTPIIWSAYGEKGMDGDGIEYVYKHVLDITNFEVPASPKFYTTEGDTVTWYEGVVLKDPGNPNNSNDWLPKDYNSSSGAFEYWIGGKYGPQGEWIPKIDPDGGNEDSNFWSDDPEGVGYFIRYQQNGQPVLDEDNNPIQDLYKYEYVTSRKRVNGEWGEFSEPKIWSTFSKEHTVSIEFIDGKWVWVIDGDPTTVVAEGQDGKGIDLKGRIDVYYEDDKPAYIQKHPELTSEQIANLKSLQNAEGDFNLGSSNVGDCFVVTDNGHIYLYVGGDDEDWEKHWHDFGEFQGEGAYVHIAWAHNIYTDEFGILRADGFKLDKEISNNSTVEYEWMGICTNNDIYDPNPEDDPANLAKYKWNYVHGRDGDTFERVYLRTTQKTIVPIIEKINGAYRDDYQGHGYQQSSVEYIPWVANPQDCGAENHGSSSDPVWRFTDDPKGPNSNYPYEWMAERKKVDGIWKDFNTPSIHSNYSHDGQSIVRSTVFKRGETRPTTPIGGTFSDPYPTNEVWYDGLPLGEGPIWMSSKIFTSDGKSPQENGLVWPDPILLRDSGDLDVEFSPQPKEGNLILPIDIGKSGANRHDSANPSDAENPGYEGQLWFDPELDEAYLTAHSKEMNWMATRTSFVDPNTNTSMWKDWIAILIKGETGEPGKTFEHAYIVFPDEEDIFDYWENMNHQTAEGVPPTSITVGSGSNATVYHWVLNTTEGLGVDPEQALWMTERQVAGSIPGPWSDPIKISGNGTPGEDAEDIEFIYKRSNRLPDPEEDRPTFGPGSNETDSNGHKFEDDDFVPGTCSGAPNTTNEGWSDNPQGVDPENKYEWMCQRVKPRGVNRAWQDWSRVFVWSAYGDTGMDGDGVEYIYTRSTTHPTPAGPKAYTSSGNTVDWKWGVEKKNNSWEPKDWDSHIIGKGNFDHWVGGKYETNQGEWLPMIDPTGQDVESNYWTDDPKGVGEEGNNTYFYEWVSSRKRVNGEWGGFSIPAIWSSYSKAPHIYIDDEGYWCDDNGRIVVNGQWVSAEGPAGQGVALKGSVDVINRADAEEGQIALQDIYPHTELIGGEEVGYYLDIAPGDCYVVRENGFLYLCLHSQGNWNYDKQAPGSLGEETWEATYSDSNTRPNWEAVGEFQGQGSHVHIAWASSKDPDPNMVPPNISFYENGKLKLIKKFITNYEDKQAGVDYDWMGIYTDYNELDPPCNYNFTADDGSTTDDSNKLNWELYEWNNVRGRDGDNYERVYLRTKSGTAPIIKCTVDQQTEIVTYESYLDEDYPTEPGHTYQDSEYLPIVVNYDSNEHSGAIIGTNCHFTDDPVSVGLDYPYQWMAERRKKLNPKTHQVEWFPFSAPSLWARYSEDGKEGVSVQIKYTSVPVSSGLTTTNVTSTTPGGSYVDTEGNTITNVVWQDSTASLTIDSQHFLWMTQRRVRGSTRVSNWLNPPIRLSGDDGEPGKDGKNIEFVYKLAGAPPTNPSTTDKPDSEGTYQGKNYSDDDYVPDGWTDNPSGVDNTSGKKYEWACQRTKPAGVNSSWEPWSDVFVWSAYGDTGMDGDGVEYVFYRYQGNGSLRKPSGPRALTSSADHNENGEGIAWYGGVHLKDNYDPNNIQSNDWIPTHWDSSNGSWEGWDSYFGRYNSHGEWIPVVRFNNDTNSPNPNEWSDDPLGVGYFDEDNNPNTPLTLYLYEWVSIRRRVNGEWGDFSDPKIWASWGTDISISDDGFWIINGEITTHVAEGKNGTGIALKGSVDFLNNKDKTKYVNDNNISAQDALKLTTLQEIQPNAASDENEIPSIVEVGDCYVVEQNRYLYTSKKKFNNSSPTANTWIPDQQGVTDWWTSGTPESPQPGPGQQNWAEVGEFQGVGSYMHIAWAESKYITWDTETPDKILEIRNIVKAYEDKEIGITYDWMGICTNHEEKDPDSWSDYKWNHVKGKDGSDYEKVYIRTTTESIVPKVNQDEGYSPGHNIKTDSEFWPKVSNYSSYGTNQVSSQYFTDDPHGVSAEWPYEWVAERRKVLNSNTQLMEWGKFEPNSDTTKEGLAKLWATYSFDGMTANLTRPGELIAIDAAGNIEGGLGVTTEGTNFAPRLYTQVKIWDPNGNNGQGQDLTYQSGTGTPAANKYTLTIVSDPNDSTNFQYGVTSEGLIYIKRLGNSSSWRLNQEECTLNITANAYGGRSFNYLYTITLIHHENTYFTYNLSNTYDSITYRTRQKKYDGLPINTAIQAQINGKTIGNTDEIPLTQGFMKSISVKSDLFDHAVNSGDITISNSTATATTRTNTTTGAFSSYGTNNGIKIRTAGNTDTGLRVDISSSGTVTLYRAGNDIDVDLPDASHSFEISCVVIYMGVEYQSTTKVFSLIEANDIILYDLLLSKVSVIERLGTYTPSTVTAKVTASDESGVETITPLTGGRIREGGNLYVKFFKNTAANLPTSYTTSPFVYPCPSFSSATNDTITAVIVDVTNTSSLVYHDVQEISISHEVPESYIDVTPRQYIVNCNSDNEIKNNQTLNFTAKLMWGGVACSKSQLDLEGCSVTLSELSGTGFNFTFSTNDNISSTGIVTGSIDFTKNMTLLSSGLVNITLKGKIGNSTTVAHETISIVAQTDGGPGPKGDYKAIAFTRTNDDISGIVPRGGSYSSRAWPNDTVVGTKTYTWSDGIPDGEAVIWACTHTFIAGESGNTVTWSNPRKMKDSPTYDVEFAMRQSSGNPPATPSSDNRHKESNPSNASSPGYDGQIWFDPELDSAYVSAHSTQFYWRAEKEINNGDDTGPWVITQIKGESEPWIKVDYGDFIVDLGPTGILQSNTTLYVNSWLYVGEANPVAPNIGDCTGVISSGSGFTITKSSISNPSGVKWKIELNAGQTYSNTDLTITLKNSNYTVSKIIQIRFRNKEQSQVKSFIFRRYSGTPAAPTSSTGSFEEPGPPSIGTPIFTWGNWKDSLPPAGTGSIWMTYRIFTSDGQPPQGSSWVTPQKIESTSTAEFEFSLSDIKPSNPSDTADSRNAQGWYNPARDPARNDWEEMIWMARRSRSSASSTWESWTIDRIKGETGITSKSVDSMSLWYKAFDSLEVDIPSNTLTPIQLENAGWAKGKILPTKDNPYLWRFTRIVYINPQSVVHEGLDLVQVWSENMINPNLLDDTDFEPEDIRDNGAISGSNLNGAYSDAGGTMGAWRTWNVSNLRTYATWGKNNGLNNDLPPLGGSYYGGIATKGDTTKTGYIIVLKQNIYDSSSGLYKVNLGNWYTLSFWIHGSSAYPNATFYLQILSRNSLGASVDGMEIVDTDAGVIVNDHVINGRTADFSYVATDDSSVSINYNQYTNNWRKFVITFKIKDTIPDNLVTALLEWKLSVAENIAKGAGVYINKPKLEIGKVATDYISSSAIRDPYPRTSVWKGGQQYYQGQYGEPYLDVVSYGGNWFRCRSTHISKNTVYNSEGNVTSAGNEPIIGHPTLYWEPAENLSFIATDLVLAETAFIDNLVATKVRTADRGIPHVEMQGSTVEFYGRHETPSIILDVIDDENNVYNGCGVLKFLDASGRTLYNLGPEGLTRINNNPSSFRTLKYKKIVSGNTLNAILNVKDGDTTSYYKFSEGYTHTDSGYQYYISLNNLPSSWDGKLYDSRSMEGSGTTAHPSGTAVTGWFVEANNGNYSQAIDLSDREGGPSRAPAPYAYDDSTFYVIFVHGYKNGKLKKSTGVYFYRNDNQIRDMNGTSQGTDLYSYLGTL